MALFHKKFLYLCFLFQVGTLLALYMVEIKKTKGVRKMNLAKKDFEDYRTKKSCEEKNVTLKVINGKKEEKTMSSEYLNEKLEYFYNNGGPIMEI